MKVNLLAMLLSVVGVSGGVLADQRPNIVFVYCDDLGFGDLAGHGHPRIQTPHLDRMAREGTDFWSFTVVNPVCSPSRTGIVTGQFPSRWGVHQHFASPAQNVQRGMPDWLDPRAPLLPRVLHEAGYRTAHFGKWHLSGGGISDAPLPASYGYDEAAVWTGPGKHVFDGTDYQFDKTEGAAHDQHAAAWMSVAATDHALHFIRQHAQHPFYLNLWLHETHHLVAATAADKAGYDDVPEPQKTYYAAVSRADRQVGRVLDLLDELKLAEETIVIFSSDNGPENSHAKPGEKFYYSQGSTGGLRGRKRSLLLGGVNVPFLVRWPGKVPAGRVDRETPLAGVDVFPTLLAATNVPAPAGYVSDGENMLPALLGQSQSRTKPLFWWWRGHHAGDDWPAFAMRDGAWQLIMDESRERIELFNLSKDRQQAHNLAAAEPGRVQLMQSQIDQWLSTLPTTVPPELQTQAATQQVPAQQAPAQQADGSPRAAPAPQTTDSAALRARAFANWDTNRDGELTLNEYRDGLTRKENAESRFKNFDRNGDNRLSRDEFLTPGK